MKATWILLLIGALVTTLSGCAESEEEISMEYRTSPIEKGRIEVMVVARGVVEPVKVVEIKSKASGEILRFPVDEGDRVTASSLLIELDNSEEVRNCDQARAALAVANSSLVKAELQIQIDNTTITTGLRNAESDLESARADLKAKELTFQAAEKLYKEGTISNEEFETTRAAYKEAQSRLESAKSTVARQKQSALTLEQSMAEIERYRAELLRSQIELDRALERLDDTRIYSPIDGILLEKMVEENQIISSGISSTSGGTVLGTVADVDNLFIIADVDESDIGKIKVGQETRITTDAYPRKEFPGRIMRIMPKGFSESTITVFRVKVAVGEEGVRHLKVNMTASVEVIISAKNDALLVPASALKSDPVTWEPGVYTLENGQPVFHEVKKGLDNGDITEIFTDLPIGTEVITSPVMAVAPGEDPREARNRRRGMRIMQRSMRKRK